MLCLLSGCALWGGPARPVVPYRGPVQSYIVESGDTLYGIGRRFAVSTEILVDLNDLSDPDSLSIGQSLKVPARTAGRASLALTPGRTEKSSNLKAGAGSLAPPNAEPPDLKSSASALKQIRLNGARRHIGNLKFPVPGGRVTSEFGWRWFSFHEGIDVAAPPGTPIYAAHDGTIVYSGAGIRGYGNILVLKTGDLLTVYGHNKQNLVRTGSVVSRGAKIAEVGQSGKASGPHCHFETRIKDSSGKFAAIDPAVFWAKAR